MTQVVELLRAMLEEPMSEAQRQTAKVPSKQEFSDHDWTDDRVRAGRAAQELVAHAVTLYHLRREFEAFMFPDASDSSLAVRVSWLCSG